MSETAKIRDIALPYCEGCGIDLGCGAEKIRREAIGIDAGMDLIHANIQKDWRDLSAVNIKQIVTDLSMFETSSFDYVYTSHFLEHLDDPQLMLAEMCRVVRPYGYLVIYLPDRVLYTEPNPEHKTMWKMDEFISILPPECLVQKALPQTDYSFFVAASVAKEKQ